MPKQNTQVKQAKGLAALPHARVKQNGKKPALLDYDEKGIFVSVHQFCQETGKDRATVDKKLRLDIIKPMRGPNGNPVYRLRDLIDLCFYRNEDGQVNVDALDPFKRKAHYSAELDKLKMLEVSGQLIPVSQVEAEQARVAKVVVQFLETLPDVLERDCGLGAQALAKVEQRIDAAREDLFKEVRDGEEAPLVSDSVAVGDDGAAVEGARQQATRGRAASKRAGRKGAMPKGAKR